MKVILVLVTSLDGKITKWDDPLLRNWSSKDDKRHFSRIWRVSGLVVLGSNTYNAERILSSGGRRIVVMTRDPSAYKKHEVPGQLEFSDASPTLLVERFQKEGYRRMLVAGGGHIAASFLKDQLVDELWLTFEPMIFGTGASLVAGAQLDVGLRLISCEIVNDQGTLITKYRILKK